MIWEKAELGRNGILWGKLECSLWGSGESVVKLCVEEDKRSHSLPRRPPVVNVRQHDITRHTES